MAEFDEVAGHTNGLIKIMTVSSFFIFFLKQKIDKFTFWLRLNRRARNPNQ